MVVQLDECEDVLRGVDGLGLDENSAFIRDVASDDRKVGAEMCRDVSVQ